VLPSHLTKETAMSTKTKTLITTAAAATLLLVAPLAAFADGGRHGWGDYRYSNDRGHGWKHGHSKHGYWQGPPRVAYVYPAPRVVTRPVFVPAPVVAVPAPVFPVPAPVVAVPAPYPYPPVPSSSVSIGFRLFF
jgi:hypothetical protein